MSINLTGPVNELGYGNVTLNLLRAFEAIGESPACWFIGPIEVQKEDVPLVTRAQQRQDNFDSDAVSLRVYHQFDLAHHIGRGVRCGFPIFELDQFKSNERHHLQSQDVLYVTSQWAADIVKANVDQPIKVVVAPLGVDHKTFRPLDNPSNGSTKFFNCGKWELRKGHDVLCEAFNLAFNKTDNVELVMHCHNPCFQDHERYLAYNSEWETYYKESPLGDKIRVSKSRLASHADVAKLMAEMDCGVFPSRAEGWNLEASEMLSMGKQVIITDYSAHTEFCTPENARLIPYRKSEVAHDGVWFKGDDQRWGAEPGQWMSFEAEEIDVLIEHMRAVHRAKQSGDNLFNAAGVESMGHFTWEQTARIISSTATRN